MNVGGNDSNIDEDPEYTEYVLTDDDFEWVSLERDGAYKNKDGDKGYFEYKGTGQEIVEIPHVNSFSCVSIVDVRAVNLVYN